MIKHLATWKVGIFLGCVACVGAHTGKVQSVSGRAADRLIGGTAEEMPRSAYDFINSVGVNTHINYFDRTYGNFPMVERELRAVGIRHVRDGAHLLNPEYNKMVYDRWARLGSFGVRFDAVVDPRSSLGPLTPEKLEHIDALANHTIESFEGPNELDISNNPNWAKVAKDYQMELFQAVKSMQTGKSIVVVGPSLAFASKGGQVGDIGDRTDFGNLHPYPAGKVPSSVLPEQTAFAGSMYGGKKIIITETGYHNALRDHRDQPAVSEQAAGKYIPRLFLENFSHGIFRTYLYEFLDEAPNAELSDFQMHWGLVRSDGTEKPAFTAMRNLLSELNDGMAPKEMKALSYSLTGAGKSHHLLLQKSDGSYVLILWQELSSYDTHNQRDISNPDEPVQVTLGSLAGTVNVFEPGVRGEPLNTYRNTQRVLLQVPDQPLVVEIRQR